LSENLLQIDALEEQDVEGKRAPNGEIVGLWSGFTGCAQTKGKLL
jgi:hypothetical protein